MANPNWRAEVEQALMEEDRSDAKSKSIFHNRDLAKYWLGSGILAVFLGIAFTYAGHSHVLSADGRNSCQGTAALCWMAAAVQIPLSCLALFSLRRTKSSLPSPAQRVSGPPPIGW